MSGSQSTIGSWNDDRVGGWSHRKNLATTGRTVLNPPGHTVRVIVRASHRLPKAVLEHPNITVIEASILDLSDEQIAELVKGCNAVTSCLPRHEL